jgi:hypothetical protein
MPSAQPESNPEAQFRNSETVFLGDTKISLLKLKQSGKSQYVIFPFTDTGLHISYHPNSNPILQEEKTGRNLAVLDIASAKKLDEKDVRSLFGYPRHKSDVLVIPIDSLSIFEKMMERPLDTPRPLEILFSRRLIYKMRAGTLREFLASNRGQYVIIDPTQEALLIYGEGLEKIGPMRFGLRRPLGSKRLSKLFSIQYALWNYLDSSDAHVKIQEPNYAVLQEWKARIVMVFSELKVRRWMKGGQIRELPALYEIETRNE